MYKKNMTWSTKQIPINPLLTQRCFSVKSEGSSAATNAEESKFKLTKQIQTPVVNWWVVTCKTASGYDENGKNGGRWWFHTI